MAYKPRKRKVKKNVPAGKLIFIPLSITQL